MKKHDQTEVEHDQIEYDRREAEPLYWFGKSENLRSAAAALEFASANRMHVQEWFDTYKDSTLYFNNVDQSTINMLCGLSLELLFKSLIVVLGKKVKYTHDLALLADQAEIQLTNQQRGILDIYSQYVLWEGKYPVPKNINEQRYFFKKLDEYCAVKVFIGKTLIIKEFNQAVSWQGFDEIWTMGYELFYERKKSYFMIKKLKERQESPD